MYSNNSPQAHLPAERTSFKINLEVASARCTFSLLVKAESLKGIVGTNRYTYSTLDNMAYKIANEFRLKFVESESIGILDSFYKEKEVYWRKVLRYCVDGNLQSVLDEYMYLIYENNKLDAILDISERIETAGNLLICFQVLLI